jgi:type IV secretion system protein VirB2/type IV secretion system protein PtlA
MHATTKPPAVSPGKLTLMTLMAVAMLIAAEPALAQSSGGLDKVNTFVENVLLVLRGISIGVVTIAIMWAGYQFLFKRADFTEIGKILGGGLLVGGASELARYLLA